MYKEKNICMDNLVMESWEEEASGRGRERP